MTEVFNDISAFGLAYQKSYGVHPYNCESLNNRCILSFLYEPLFVVGSETFEVSPVLAESYDVSGDGLTTTVHIRPEARFSDGSPVTAQDAAIRFFPRAVRSTMAPACAMSCPSSQTTRRP